LSLLVATRYVARLDLVDLETLWQDGIRFLMVDRDNTCMPRDTMRIPAAIIRWFEEAHRLGFATCLVSNNFHGHDVEGSAELLQSSVIHHAMKPVPFALEHAMRKEGFSAQESILIGDQVFTDVVAGNLAGVRTILVRPQSRSDLWYTQILRIFEGLALRGHTFEGE